MRTTSVAAAPKCASRPRASKPTITTGCARAAIAHITAKVIAPPSMLAAIPLANDENALGISANVDAGNSGRFRSRENARTNAQSSNGCTDSTRPSAILRVHSSHAHAAGTEARTAAVGTAREPPAGPRSNAREHSAYAEAPDVVQVETVVRAFVAKGEADAQASMPNASQRAPAGSKPGSLASACAPHHHAEIAAMADSAPR